MTVSKHSKAFDEMLGRLSQYPRSKVLSVKDPRTRTVLAGIIEGVEVPEVRESFRVLYEDYPPIRFGGDFLFQQLESTIKKTVTNAELSESGLSSSSLLKAKQVFKLADTDGSGELDTQEVSAFLQAVKDRGLEMTWGQAEDFVKDLDKDMSGTVSFPEFVRAAKQLLDSQPASDKDQAEVVAKISLSLGGTARAGTSKSVNKYSTRFDGMIESFREMEKSVDIDAIENKRLATVFRGCIVGGRTQGVVDALKVVYVDYRIIRMCGDLIFGLVKALMQR